MDKDRQIRFLYPPLIFLSSITFGIWLDYPNEIGVQVYDFIMNKDSARIAVAILGAGSFVLVLGYLIGTVTLVFLRLAFIWNKGEYEFKLSGGTYKRIGKLILSDKSDSIKEGDQKYAAIVFDHAYIDDRIHSWIVRRWNAFLIASFSTVGLLTSLLSAIPLEISFTLSWTLTTVVFLALFVWQAIISWRETMKMISFLTRVEKFK